MLNPASRMERLLPGGDKVDQSELALEYIQVCMDLKRLTARKNQLEQIYALAEDDDGGDDAGPDITKRRRGRPPKGSNMNNNTL